MHRDAHVFNGIIILTRTVEELTAALAAVMAVTEPEDPDAPAPRDNHQRLTLISPGERVA
ncbi:MAG TPA: hypothetical protein VJY35_15540 [Candidatus Eisenbacteria bacterium]|nr:hypothetical protein [Candidatus Eisenbacteria bacterium]